MEVLHHMDVCRVNLGVYVCESEVSILLCVVVYCDAAHIRVLNEELVVIRQTYTQWAYREERIIPIFADASDVATISSKLPFWNVINTYVLTNGPMRPVRLFRNSLQAIYSRAKGGVDVATQFRSRLNDGSLHVPWEPKIVLYFMKTLLVKGLIAWKIQQCDVT